MCLHRLLKLKNIKTDYKKLFHINFSPKIQKNIFIEFNWPEILHPRIAKYLNRKTLQKSQFPTTPPGINLTNLSIKTHATYLILASIILVSCLLLLLIPSPSIIIVIPALAVLSLTPATISLSSIVVTPSTFLTF